MIGTAEATTFYFLLSTLYFLLPYIGSTIEPMKSTVPV
jgi:hypothetical protein